MSLSGRGNPYFMRGLKQRREKLKELLLNSSKELWPKIKARFAVDEGVSIDTVNKYFLTLKEGGYLDNNPGE